MNDEFIDRFSLMYSSYCYMRTTYFLASLHNLPLIEVIDICALIHLITQGWEVESWNITGLNERSKEIVQQILFDREYYKEWGDALIVKVSTAVDITVWEKAWEQYNKDNYEF